MLTAETISAIADELAEAERSRGVVPRITARYPDATIEDSYAIQGVWRDTHSPPAGAWSAARSGSRRARCRRPPASPSPTTA